MGLLRLFGISSLVLAVSISASSFLSPALQPSQPNYPYISPAFSVEETGSCVDGTRVWIYRPETSKAEGADVILYFHGYSIVEPDAYAEHIAHLVRQGNFVVFPQFQEGFCPLFSWDFLKGLWTLLTRKSSPAAWLDRAAQTTNAAIDTLSYNNIYIFGHSLGAAFGMMWGSVMGEDQLFTKPVEAAVLSSPQPAGFGANPDFVMTLFFFVFGEDIDVPAEAPKTLFPIAVLHGSSDTIAPLEDIEPSYNSLGSSSKAIYQAQTDQYGQPNLNADHSLSLTGSARQTNNMDWRYTWSGLDQVVNLGTPVTELSFDMGIWSDGEPVQSVVRIE